MADLRLYPDCCGAVTTPRYVGTFGRLAFVLTGRAGEDLTLWSTDGTEAGTTRLFEHIGSSWSVSRSFLVGRDGLYFAAGNEARLRRLWRSDGTAAGTVPISRPFVDYPVSAHGGEVLYIANGLRELWVTDGDSPHLLKNLSNHTLAEAAILGDTVFIATGDGLVTWRSGQTAVTVLAQAPSWKPVAAKDRVFFIGQTATDGAELWISDGTPAGTHLIRNIRTRTQSAFTESATSMSALNDRLVFLTDQGELGVSDGTPAGTSLLELGRPQQQVTFAILNGRALFTYDGSIEGRRLWVSDGTPAGTHVVRRDLDLVRLDTSVPQPIASTATRAYYYDVVPRRTSLELFQTDGTHNGTSPVSIYRAAGAFVQAAGNLVTIGDKVFFSAGNNEHGVEPWVSDGTEAGTHLIADLVRDPAGSAEPASLVATEDRLYFSGTSDKGPAVWSTDGTAPGTTTIAEARNFSTLARPFAAAGNRVILEDGHSLFGSEGGVPAPLLTPNPYRWLYLTRPALEMDGRAYLTTSTQVLATDGTAAGTRILHPKHAESVISFGGRPWFIDDSGALFTTDGTVEGVRQVALMRASVEWRPVQRTVAVGGAVYAFDHVSSDSMTRLWKYPGPAGDAVLVKEIPGVTSPAYDYRMECAPAGAMVLFTVWRLGQQELWRSDGTSEGTVLVRALTRDVSRIARQFVSLGDRVLFTCDDGVGGRELWASDGTAEGTRRLSRIRYAGVAGQDSNDKLVVVDGWVWFAAYDDGRQGRELWQSDGTPEGTRLAADIRAGVESSSPGELTRFGDALYFAATTGDAGRELWAYPLTDEPAVRVEDAYAFEDELRVRVPVRLTRASNRRVTVDYATANASAHAGRDYTPATETLVFEPGETLRHINVPLVSDDTPDDVRTMIVRLTNASTRIERSVAAALIEDDDRSADVSLAIEMRGAHYWIVRNAGPSPASHVRVCGAGSCDEVGRLAAGEVRKVSVYPKNATDAVVRLWEQDPDPSNNTVSVASSSRDDLHVQPSLPRVGETGMLTFAFFPYSYERDIQLSSSDPSVLTVPARVKSVAGQPVVSVPFIPLKSGSVTLAASVPAEYASVRVRVVEPGEALRVQPIVSLTTIMGAPDKTSRLLANVTGSTVDGARPAGTVTFFVDDNVLATATLVDGAAQATAPRLSPGSHELRLAYSGDANFFDDTYRGIYPIGKRSPSFTAMRLGESPDVVVIVRGVDPSPTGTVTIEGTAHPLPADLASVTVTIPAGVRTVAVAYAGDDYHYARSATVPITTSSGRRRRAP